MVQFRIVAAALGCVALAACAGDGGLSSPGGGPSAFTGSVPPTSANPMAGGPPTGTALDPRDRPAAGAAHLRALQFGEPASVETARGDIGAPLDADVAQGRGLVTFALDELDWEDEIRVFLEERASFSPDSLTGLEANLRFAGPETMETKIFGRLTAWQNWIFQRPNAVGEAGALGRYGTGRKPQFDTKRV